MPSTLTGTSKAYRATIEHTPTPEAATAPTVRRRTTVRVSADETRPEMSVEAEHSTWVYSVGIWLSSLMFLDPATV
ncbi:hypothetical protein [Nocardia sp. NPDC004711]